MESFKVILNESTDKRLTKIIKEYWQIENGKFENSPKSLTIKYGIDFFHLSLLVRENSSCEIIYGYCKKCSSKLSVVVYSQTKFNEKKGLLKEPICESCLNELRKYQKEQKRLILQLKDKIISETFHKAIEEERWYELTKEEFRILILLEHFKEKRLIIDWVFNGNFYDKAVWNLVKVLELKGLVNVEREVNNHVIAFHFPETLSEKIDLRMPGLREIIIGKAYHTKFNDSTYTIQIKQKYT